MCYPEKRTDDSSISFSLPLFGLSLIVRREECVRRLLASGICFPLRDSVCCTLHLLAAAHQKPTYTNRPFTTTIIASSSLNKIFSCGEVSMLSILLDAVFECYGSKVSGALWPQKKEKKKIKARRELISQA